MHYLVFLDPWVKLNFLPVCFGARDNQYGSFNVPYGGKIAAVKLIHLSGYVMCQAGYPSYWSFWGCGTNPAVKNHVSVAITTSNNALISPPSLFFTYAGGAGNWAELPGYNSYSPEIVLPRFSPYKVSAGQELRVWYGEDLAGFTEHDNGGWACCNVYALYV